MPSMIEGVKQNEIVNADDVDAFLTPFLYEHLNWRKMDAEFSPYKKQSGSTAFPEHNSLEILDYLLFENLIDNRFYNSKSQLEEYQDLKSTLELIENLIRNEKIEQG